MVIFDLDKPLSDETAIGNRNNTEMTSTSVSLLASLARLNKLLVVERSNIAQMYMFALLAGLVQLSLPLGIQSIISFVMAGRFSTSIIVLISMVVLGVFINGLLQVRQLQILEKIKQKLFFRYSMEYTDRLPRLNVERLDKEYLPELVNRFFDSVSLQKGLDKILLDLPAAIIQIGLGLTLLAFYHPVFIAFGLVLIVIVVSIIRITSPKGLHTALRASTYKYRVAAWLEEIARTIKSFKYARQTSLHLHKSDQLVGQYLESRTAHFSILLTQFWSLISFKLLITAAMLIIGSYLLINQEINVGQFIAADIVIIAIIASVEKLITNLEPVYDALVSVEKTAVITEAEIEKTGSLRLAGTSSGISIQFQGVSFAYAEQHSVLSNINFEIVAGQMVQLAGASGAGKSTVLRLLTGAFTHFSGKVLIDGVPIENYDIESLRMNTGILLGSQDIFAGTLWQNLTMDNEEISLAEINFLVHLTGLSEFLQECKEGFDTQLSPVGNKLSNRVRKNILLIRALAGQHRLLLLEDPFGHLQEDYKSNVLQFIKTRKKATVLFTSQEIDLDPLCDQVLLMNNDGEIILKLDHQQR